MARRSISKKRSRLLVGAGLGRGSHKSWYGSTTPRSFDSVRNGQRTATFLLALTEYESDVWVMELEQSTPR